MSGVRPAPETVGRQGQNTDDPSDPVIGHAVAKEGPVTAVVLDHEQPHEEAGSRYGHQQREPPIAERVRCPAQAPEHDERAERDRDFDDAANVARFTIAREDFRPVSRVGRF